MIKAIETFYTDDLNAIHAIDLYITEGFASWDYSMNGSKHEYTLKTNTVEEMEEAIDKFRTFVKDIGFQT